MTMPFTRDERGVAALEFALLAPILIVIYFGLAELTEAMMATRKVSHVASVVGDLAAQDMTITPADITDIFSVGQTLLTPFPSTTLKLRLTSVTADAKNTPIVDWSQGSGMTAYNKGDVITLPSGGGSNAPLLTAGQSLIVAEDQYVWTSPIAYFMPHSTPLSDTFYLAPRQGSAVTCPTC